MAASGADLLGAVWGLGVRAKRFRDAQQAIGELIAEALASAICPDSPNDAAAVTAALAVRRELRKTPVPIATGREQGRASRLGDKLAVGLRIRGVPTVARFGESTAKRLVEGGSQEPRRVNVSGPKSCGLSRCEVSRRPFTRCARCLFRGGLCGVPTRPERVRVENQASKQLGSCRQEPPVAERPGTVAAPRARRHRPCRTDFPGCSPGRRR